VSHSMSLDSGWVIMVGGWCTEVIGRAILMPLCKCSGVAGGNTVMGWVVNLGGSL